MLIKNVKATYGIIDNTLKVDTPTPTTSGASEFADIASSLNSDQKQKLTYLENNYFRLDGTHIFPEAGKKYATGWESSQLADEEGNIDAWVEYVFANKHVSVGVVLYFSENAIAKDFTIAYYDGNTLLGSQNITNNTQPRRAITYIVEDWNKIRVTFSKVTPQQRARLESILFGISLDISGDIVLEISAEKTTDMSSDYFTSGDVSLSFYNDGSVFKVDDIRNLPLELQTEMKLSIYTLSPNATAYEAWGDYFSQNTTITDDGQTITITGYDNLYELNTSYYRKGIVYPNGRSLAAWAQEVADDIGLDIVIDQSFNGIISKGYITEVPHREALRQIAEAGCGRLRIDNNGILHLEPNTIGDVVATLSKDDIVDGTYSSENKERILGVAVNKHTFIASKTDAVELGYIESVLITADKQEVEVVYGEYPADTSTIQLFVNPQTSAVASNIRAYSDRVVFDLTGTEGDETWVTVTGKPYSHAQTTIIAGTQTSVKTIENNFLLTGDLAQQVADYQLSIIVNKYEHTAETITEAEIALGDKINVLGDNIIVEKVGFSLTYDRHEVTVGGVDVGKIDI